MQSQKYRLDSDQAKRWGLNLLKFTAPAIAVFFAQLALDVEPKVALLVALLALYGAISDYFKKLK